MTNNHRAKYANTSYLGPYTLRGEAITICINI